MKIIKLKPRIKSTKKATVTAFLYKDAAALAGTAFQFLKNNTQFFNPPSGLIA